MALQKVGIEVSKTRDFARPLGFAISDGDLGSNSIPAESLEPETEYFVRAYFDNNGMRTWSDNIGRFWTLGNLFGISNEYAGVNDFILTISGTPASTDLEWSKDGRHWTAVDLTQQQCIVSMQEGEKVYLRSSTGFSKTGGELSIDCEHEYSAFGDARNLIDYTDIENASLSGCDFIRMFSGSVNIIDASRMELPFTVPSGACYFEMFENCENLAGGPDVMLTSLASDCLQGMFNGCTLINRAVVYVTSWDTWNTYLWLGSTAAAGDFYNLGGATNIPTGDWDGVPPGWTVHTSL